VGFFAPDVNDAKFIFAWFGVITGFVLNLILKWALCPFFVFVGCYLRLVCKSLLVKEK